MSNTRIMALGWIAGFFIATVVNLQSNGDAITNCARSFLFSALLAALAVAFLGDSK